MASCNALIDFVRSYVSTGNNCYAHDPSRSHIEESKTAVISSVKCCATVQENSPDHVASSC